ncbi:MAG TPA: hypothetical protein VM240_14780 [Verrucomicrobiae bacterium]|nr:hypothetical protein [Verrucomicrobiae bacterium]
MRDGRKVWLLCLGLAICGATEAAKRTDSPSKAPVKAESDVSGRVFLFAGSLSSEYETTGFPTSEDGAGLLGGGVGFTYLTGGSNYADASIEYATPNDEGFERTEYQASFGGYLGDFNLFTGYRMAKFGDSFSSDDDSSACGCGNTEQGPFVGAGYGFRIGRAVTLSTSIALNIFDVEFDDPFYPSYESNGVSLKAVGALANSPHSVFLQLRRFTGDNETAIKDNGLSGIVPPTEYEEIYAHLGYVFSFGAGS